MLYIITIYSRFLQLFKLIYFSRQGLTSNPNTSNPLTNLPDYSFKDGRPTPIGVRQLARMETQRKYAVCKISSSLFCFFIINYFLINILLMS